MSYHTYTTDAIVCSSRAYNTADKTFQLFTRELGMLTATARSVREERSRQRYALQDLALVRVSLVSGKAGWRIGSIVPLAHPFLAATDRESRSVVLHLVRNLRRYVHGEVAYTRVFDDAVAVMSRTPEVATDTARTLVDIFILRMLYDLGYIAPTHSAIEALVYPTSFPDVYEPLPHDVRAVIEHAHSVSHLT